MSITVISTPEPLALIKNPTGLTLSTNSSDPLTKVRCRVYIESEPYSEVYDFAFEQELTPDASGLCTFYIHQQLRELLAFDLPDLSDTGAHVAGRVSRRYQIYYAEKLSTDEQFIAEFYHEDLTGGPSQYLAWLDIGQTLDASADYMIIAETSDLGNTANITLRVGGTSQTYGTRELQNNVVQCTGSAAVAAFDEIRIPAYVKCTIIKDPITYTLL